MRLFSSDLFDPSGDRLALGNCTVEQATHCPQCGHCTCKIHNVSRLPDLTNSHTEWKVVPTCPLHGSDAHHPMADVYDEPHILASLEEDADSRPLTNATMVNLYKLEKFEQGRWSTPFQLTKAMTKAYGHCELAYDDGGAVIMKCFAKTKQGVYLGHLTSDNNGYYIQVLPGRKVGGIVHRSGTTPAPPAGGPGSPPPAAGTAGAYSTRPIRGRSSEPTHGAGLAVDVNWSDPTSNPVEDVQAVARALELDYARRIRAR